MIPFARAHVDLTANDSDFESPILRPRKASLTGTTSHESFFDSGTFEDDEDEEDVRDEEGKEKGKKTKIRGSYRHWQVCEVCNSTDEAKDRM